MELLQNWMEKLHKTFIASGYYKIMLEGLGNTIRITIGALVIGVAIGVLISVVKYLSEDNKIFKPFAKACDIYVTAIRGIPVVVLLLIFYLLIMRSCTNGVLVATITFGINSGAYMAELIRSGINAVDKGQLEAGRSLGLSRLQTMQMIILPQAVRYVLPAVGNEFIALLKETSVAGYVAVTDLTRAGNLVRNNTHDAFNPLMVVALVYLVMVIGLTTLMQKLEQKLAAAD
ncbi:MAG: amino acid ABC transporter permease [Oscillospiraceae bacterium]|nr:amino acid ABC transporter permease [Oscillospiraceae bacterium]